MVLASFQHMLGFSPRNVRNATISHFAVHVSAQIFICVSQEIMLAGVSSSLGHADVPVSENSFIR